MSEKSSTFAPAFEKSLSEGAKCEGPLAQLNRVPHYGCGGCRFESCMDHKKSRKKLRLFCFLCMFDNVIGDMEGLYLRLVAVE